MVNPELLFLSALNLILLLRIISHISYFSIFYSEAIEQVQIRKIYAMIGEEGGQNEQQQNHWKST